MKKYIAMAILGLLLGVASPSGRRAVLRKKGLKRIGYGVAAIIIGALVWSFASRLLIELKVLLTGSLLLRELLGSYTIPKVEAELWTRVLIGFVICVIIAVIAGAIAGGLGHFFVFSKKRWEEEKKFKIASSLMGIICPIVSLLFGYLIMFSSIIGHYFAILLPIDIFFIFFAIIARIYAADYMQRR
jgi:hypothetical protein